MLSYIHLHIQDLRAERVAKREQLILNALAGCELTAYQIIKKTKIWNINLYPALRKLENEGRISSRWTTPINVPFENRPRLYRIAAPPRL